MATAKVIENTTKQTIMSSVVTASSSLTRNLSSHVPLRSSIKLNPAFSKRRNERTEDILEFRCYRQRFLVCFLARFPTCANIRTRTVATV